MDEEDKKNLFVLGMDRISKIAFYTMIQMMMENIGTVGYMISIHALDGDYVAQHVQDLQLP